MGYGGNGPLQNRYDPLLTHPPAWNLEIEMNCLPVATLTGHHLTFYSKLLQILCINISRNDDDNRLTGIFHDNPGELIAECHHSGLH